MDKEGRSGQLGSATLSSSQVSSSIFGHTAAGQAKPAQRCTYPRGVYQLDKTLWSSDVDGLVQERSGELEQRKRDPTAGGERRLIALAKDGSLEFERELWWAELGR